jgi:hypothetical protein
LKILLSLFFCIIALVGCANNSIDNNNANYNATPLSREEEVSNNITNDTNNSNSDMTAKYSKTKDNIDIVDSDKIISTEYINSSPYISVDKACKHNKIYDKYILTSNPPQQRWKCKKCEETGIDIIGTV